MVDLLSLKGKTALVTGASGGLGAHFAAVLARAGAQVIITARRKDALANVADGINAAGGRCTTTALDVTNLGNLAAVEQFLAPVDILVNNAGIAIDKPILDQTESDWDTVMDTNVKGMFLLSQAFARALKSRKARGSIINIASVLGVRQGAGAISYCVSKAAVIQLTKVAALELARYDVRVNAIAPGYLISDINRSFWDTAAGDALIKRIPQRRLGKPEDLDGPLLLLASDASFYITGSVITVDGGHLVSGL